MMLLKRGAGGTAVRLGAGLAALACLGAGPCWAGDVLAAHVAWRHAPTHAEQVAAYPAGRSGPGAATLRCEVRPDGKLDGCAALSDSDSAFERAAQSLIPGFAAVFPAGVEAGDRAFVDIDFHFDRPAAPIELAEPQFIQRADAATPPSGDFPAAAAKAGLESGLGVVECDGLADGRLAGCVVARETPAGMGFGAAALALAATLRLNPWQNGEAIAGARVRLPIYIDAPGAEADPSFTRTAAVHVPYPWNTNPYYPMQAYLQHATGEVTLQCVLARSGALSDCVSLDETPSGLHFADAALKMAAHRAITVKPARDDGRADAEVVRVRVPFTL